MSASDTTQFLSQFNALKSRHQHLLDDATFASISRELSDLTARAVSLPTDIERVRQRGYAFAKYLEHKAEVLSQHWATIAQQAQAMLQTEAAALQPEMRQADTLLQKGEMASAKPAMLSSIVPMLESQLQEVEQRASAAAERIKSAYATLATDINGTVEQLRKINWYLDQRDEASFSFLAGESVFLAAQAEWVATGKGGKDPDGILYLTDQRLLFEQKETTGKTLGMFGGKKTQELEWEIPLNKIERVEAENKGLFGGKDMLNFTLSSGAPYPRLTIEVKGGVASKFWAAQITRMISGGANDERAVQPDAETLEAIRSAPTACHVCGATLPRLVASQTQITCEYCGAVIRI
jgi:hypothetical protein